jgi:hypothetical protein
VGLPSACKGSRLLEFEDVAACSRCQRRRSLSDNGTAQDPFGVGRVAGMIIRVSKPSWRCVLCMERMCSEVYNDGPLPEECNPVENDGAPFAGSGLSRCSTGLSSFRVDEAEPVGSGFPPRTPAFGRTRAGRPGFGPQWGRFP